MSYVPTYVTAVCNGYTLLTCNIELSTCRVYSYDVSMCRDWSVEASGGHGNDPRTASNHGAARDGLGVKVQQVAY